MQSNSQACKILILCGGKGTRLGKLGRQIPKTLVPLEGRPILYHKLSHGIESGFKDFILAVGYKSQQIVDACNTFDIACNLHYSDSGEEAGMLERIYNASDLFEDRLIVTYGDSLANIDLRELMAFHRQKDSLLTLVTAPIQSPFGLVNSDHKGRVRTLEEKPVLYYYIGTFAVEKQAFEYLSEQIVKWPDGKGLIAFFKVLMAIDKLYTYPHAGTDITFNTVEELNAAEDGFLKFYTHFK